jgi:putative Mg2+ transporter-C (MgtC) family protein
MSWWDEAAHTIAAEFSDVGDASASSPASSCACSWRRRSASSASNAARPPARAPTCWWRSVRRSSCSVPQQTGIAPTDMSRVIQGLVAGVGFLCAGTILKLGRDERRISTFRASPPRPVCG